MTKNSVTFNLTVLGTVKEDCDIKTSEMLSFRPLMNDSATIGIFY